MRPEDDIPLHCAKILSRNVLLQSRNINLRANIGCRIAQDLCGKLGMEAQLHAGDALRARFRSELMSNPFN